MASRVVALVCLFLFAQNEKGGCASRSKHYSADQKHIVPLVRIQPQLDFWRVGHYDFQWILRRIGKLQREIFCRRRKESAWHNGFDKPVLSRWQSAHICLRITIEGYRRYRAGWGVPINAIFEYK